MGEQGNQVMVYDTDTVILKHQLNPNYAVKLFEFNKNGTEAIIVTTDQKIKVFKLDSFQGTYLRELLNVHRGSVNSADLSLNGGFMMTGGDDSLIKAWDYEADRNVPFFY